MESGVDKINLITKRNLERKLDLLKRKEDRDNLGANNEKLSYFEETFSAKCTNIENLLQKSSELDKKDLAEHFDSVSKEILLLQKYVAASNLFLRSYDIKKCQEVLQDLGNKSKDLEEILLPKKRFGFKNKPKTKPAENRKDVGEDEVDEQVEAPVIPKQLCGFSNTSGEVLIMTQSEVYKRDVSAENLENCTVKFFGTPSTAHLNNLKNCYVFTGPVSTSIFAENCENCTLVIACQQLRLHSSRNVNIYLHVTSRAIMEDSKQIFLAPYNWKYDGMEKDFQESGLDSSVNNWQSVDDFDWLNVKQSPNWAVLDEEQVIRDWDR